MSEWQPLSEFDPQTFSGHYVRLLYSFPSGTKAVAGMYREGTFFGKTVTGWFAPEKIREFGRPEHGMWIDGFIKGWMPYNYQPPVIEDQAPPESASAQPVTSAVSR